MVTFTSYAPYAHDHSRLGPYRPATGIWLLALTLLHDPGILKEKLEAPTANNREQLPN